MSFIFFVKVHRKIEISSFRGRRFFLISRPFLSVIRSRESRSGNGEVRRYRKLVSDLGFVDEFLTSREVATHTMDVHFFLCVSEKERKSMEIKKPRTISEKVQWNEIKINSNPIKSH